MTENVLKLQYLLPQSCSVPHPANDVLITGKVGDPAMALDTIDLATAASLDEGPAEVRHYSISEVAKMWHLSVSSIVRIFEKESDVLVISTPVKGKRSKRTFRIPAFVLERVRKKFASRQ